MQIYADIDPVFITNAFRALLTQPDEDREVNRFQLGNWFPTAFIAGTNYEWNDKRTLRTFTEAMPARAFDTEAVIKGREGVQKKSGSMIPFAEKYIITELDLVMQAAARASDPEAAADLDEIFRDLERGVRALRARMEIAYAECIRLGTISFAENGMQPEAVDFGRSANNTSAAGTAWSDVANADPNAEEDAVLDYLLDEQDLDWDDLIAVCNRNTYREWAATDAIRNQFNSVRVLDTIPDSELARMRRDLGKPDIVQYNASARGYGQASGTKLIPDGDWLYLPKNGPIGATQYGAPAITNMPGGVNFELQQQPGPVAYVGFEVDPPRSYTVIDAIGMPVAYDINATYRLTV